MKLIYICQSKCNSCSLYKSENNNENNQNNDSNNSNSNKNLYDIQDVFKKIIQLSHKLNDNISCNESLLEEIKAAGGEAIIVKADVTKQEGVQALIDQSKANFGDQIDILVNVAGGIVARKTLDEMYENFFNTSLHNGEHEYYLAPCTIIYISHSFIRLFVAPSISISSIKSR